MKTSSMVVALLVPLCLFGLAGQTVVYRCVDEASGTVRFSDRACGPGEHGGSQVVRPNTLDASGAREQALRSEIRQLREQLEAQERRVQAQPATGLTQPDLQAQRIDGWACQQARRSYELAAGSLLQNQADIEMKRSAMYGACGMREPDRTEVNVNTNTQVETGGRYGPHPGPSVISNCDSGGCWDTRGQRYPRGAGNTYFGPSGACQRIGGQMHCP